jgi:predicted Zn-dependent protease
MNKFLIYFLIPILSGCASVPVTNRKQLSLVSEYEIIQSSNIAYNQFLDDNTVVSEFHPDAILVNKVGNKLAVACRQFLINHGDVERVAGFDWEFNLVESEEKNAWCMPGGKVVIYQGILSETIDETGLAVVLSHEIAHAIARHGSERASQQLLAQMGGDALQTVLNSLDTKGIDFSEILSQTYDMGLELGMLKFSRNHETEADKMGLVFMEYAGYDSSVALEFWQRMANSSQYGIPAFMSTHPTDEKRIMEIEAFIPVAKSYVF